jgi:putative cell wall-binding protein
MKVFTVIAMLIALSHHLAFADAQSGEAKSFFCDLCHNTGIHDGTAPLLQAQPAPYLVLQLQAFTPTPVVRIAGPDRYLTAVAVSKSAFSAGVPAVYLAAGTDFPDALGGAAAAGFTDGPILLVGPNFYESPTLGEMVRLDPHALFILGGEASIDDGVVDVFESTIAP